MFKNDRHGYLTCICYLFLNLNWLSHSTSFVFKIVELSNWCISLSSERHRYLPIIVYYDSKMLHFLVVCNWFQKLLYWNSKIGSIIVFSFFHFRFLFCLENFFSHQGTTVYWNMECLINLTPAPSPQNYQSTNLFTCYCSKNI